MDSLSIPLVSVASRPREALKIMQDHRRSAVLVQDGKAFFVATASALLGARRRREPSLKGIPRDRPVKALSAGDLKQRGLKLVHPLDARLSADKVFGTRNAPKYLLLAATRDSGAGQSVALVITRHEYDGEELSSPADWFCRGPRQHSLPPVKRNAGGNCGACNSPLDRI